MYSRRILKVDLTGSQSRKANDIDINGRYMMLLLHSYFSVISWAEAVSDPVIMYSETIKCEECLFSIFWMELELPFSEQNGIAPQ